MFALFFSLLFIFTSCSTSKRTITEEKIFDISSVNSVNKLVFTMPTLDKKMCETFPKLIITEIESMSGVIDAEFIYEGHIITVYYSPEYLNKDDIMQNSVYSWVGTIFVSDNSETEKTARELYQNRESNNNFLMPDNHMDEEIYKI